MDNAQIIVVEDEQEISELIKNQLSTLGHSILTFGDGKKALDYIQSNDGKDAALTSLFILDRMLPSVNGMEVCKFIRLFNPTKNTPILMLTALSTPEQIVEGLDAGADDYMTKPFDLAVLLARVRSLLRRKELSTAVPENKNILRHKELVVDLDQCKVWIEGQPLELTLSEYKILCCFLLSPGKVLTRNQLVEYIQDGPVHVTDRTIDTHIFGLRKKLGEYSQIIETIRGIGYRVIGHD
ncbi:MAG: response regulator transcription factor [Bdellovibrionales bacterium]|nr:response regulator transcription factor [Bdellovibrionales bacterium]